MFMTINRKTLNVLQAYLNKVNGKVKLIHFRNQLQMTKIQEQLNKLNKLKNPYQKI